MKKPPLDYKGKEQEMIQEGEKLKKKTDTIVQNLEWCVLIILVFCLLYFCFKGRKRFIKTIISIILIYFILFFKKV